MLNNEIEEMRYELYKCIEESDYNLTLQISQELDKLIVKYYNLQCNNFAL